jgi:hypothetical protein
MKRRTVFFPCAALCACFCVLIFGCFSSGPTGQSASGGTGSEIVGTAEYPDTAAGAHKSRLLRSLTSKNSFPLVSGSIFVYPRSFVPDTSWAAIVALPSTVTDDSGNFRAKDVPRGEVVVEASDGTGKGLVRSIVVDRDSTIYSVGVMPLEQNGAIKIQAHSLVPGKVRFYVAVRGTRLIVRGNQSDVDVTLENVPVGISHTVNIRVFEPIYLEMDISVGAIVSGVTNVLQPFQIQ